MPNRRAERGIQKQLTVTSRCLAIVLNEESSRSEDDIDNLNGKEIFEDFKLRNKSCYWNPALIDSIDSLEYLGFVSPSTLFVGGLDLHLENLRTAWGRRVLKNPTNFRIKSIGEISGIDMDVIPQTQFIPLSEILCLVIMDLNNKQVFATLEVIEEQLKHRYKGMQLPSTQHIYDTLGTLIKERKVFHTGSGYFVVTPDTYRSPEDPTKTVPLPWLHYNPNYIPVLNSNQQNMTRSISCQVTLANEHHKFELVPVKDRADMKTGVMRDSQDRLSDQEKPNLARSLSARRSREKKPVKNEDMKDFKRSSSVRGRDKDNKKSEEVYVVKPTVTKAKDKGEKKSLISKIFGKKKKKTDTPKKVEHATFSGQFPPPEWTWYQEQVEKQQRIQTWMQHIPHQRGQQHYDSVPVFRHNFQHNQHQDYRAIRYGQLKSDAVYGHHVAQQENHYKVPRSLARHNPINDDYEEIEDVDIHSRMRSAVPLQCHPHDMQGHRKTYDTRQSTRRREKSKRYSLERNCEGIYQNVQTLPSHNYQSPAMPYHVEDRRYKHVTHPACSSTPRVPGMWNPMMESYYPEPVLQETYNPYPAVKSKRKSHRRHQEIETRHRMPQKNTSFSMSHDSGVNLIGQQHAELSEENLIRHCRQFQDDMSIRNNLRKYSYDDSKEEVNIRKSQMLCEVEINKCVKHKENDYIATESQLKKETSEKISSNGDSAVTLSEQSVETVVKLSENKDIEEITKETSDMELGDSGFSSPRNCSDNPQNLEQNAIKTKVEELQKGSNSNLCEKNVYQKSDESSPETKECQSDDKENKVKVINNLKHLHSDYSLLTRVNHIHNRMPLNIHQSLQQIPRKFDFDSDDYEVVGIL